MIPKISDIKVIENYILQVSFDDGKTVIYDVTEDMNSLPGYDALKENGLFHNFSLDESRTIVSWTEDIDLPSDILYEYGIEKLDIQKC